MSSPTPDREAAAAVISARELASAADISEERLAALVRLGLLEPTEPGGNEFHAAAALRLRRMIRLHGDLGVSFLGASIIVDLLERLDRLER